jgi:hypothetical protein
VWKLVRALYHGVEAGEGFISRCGSWRGPPHHDEEYGEGFLSMWNLGRAPYFDVEPDK